MHQISPTRIFRRQSSHLCQLFLLACSPNASRLLANHHVNANEPNPLLSPRSLSNVSLLHLEVGALYLFFPFGSHSLFLGPDLSAKFARRTPPFCQQPSGSGPNLGQTTHGKCTLVDEYHFNCSRCFPTEVRSDRMQSSELFPGCKTGVECRRRAKLLDLCLSAWIVQAHWSARRTSWPAWFSRGFAATNWANFSQFSPRNPATNSHFNWSITRQFWAILRARWAFCPAPSQPIGPLPRRCPRFPGGQSSRGAKVKQFQRCFCPVSSGACGKIENSTPSWRRDTMRERERDTEK